MKLSFCTTCMNRNSFLKQTLPTNLELIKKYNCELVIVNYNSKDDLDEYMNNYEEDILNDIIKYIKVENKIFFDPRHAKNIAYKYSSGDILINLDSDNTLTEKLILEIIDDFNNDINTIIHCKYNIGFIVMSRYNFFLLGGYNEKFKNYGVEDTDLVMRGSMLLGLKLKYLDEDLVKVIENTNEERLINMENPDIDIVYSMKQNLEIRNHCLNYKIINPNLYNNIDWGKIS